MKCKTCKKHMQPVSVTHDFINNGKSTKVINIPAEQCPQCGKIEVSDFVREHAKWYVDFCESSIVGFMECEAVKDTMLIVTQMMW